MPNMAEGEGELPVTDAGGEQFSRKFEGRLVRHRVLIDDPGMAGELSAKGYGDKGEGPLSLRLYEALHLMRLGWLTVKGPKQVASTFQDVVKRSLAEDAKGWTKFLVYRDLRSRGYVVREGYGLAADLRIYPRGEYGKNPAKYVVIPINEGGDLKVLTLQKMIDAVYRMGKEPIVAVVERRGEAIYYQGLEDGVRGPLTASGYISITRPVNSLMIGLAVLVGEAVAVSTIRLELATLMGYLTGVLITAFSMVINDMLDFEVDRANAAKRPLVVGSVSMSGAKILSVALLLAGLATSAYTGVATFAIAAIFSAVATLYNWKLKERGFSGNVAVALSMMIPFIYGGVLAQGVRWSPVLDMMALTAFLAGLGREVIKGIIDVEGDALRNVRSLARSKGDRYAGAVGAVFFLAAVGSSLVPPLLVMTSAFYDVVIGATDLLFVGLALFVMRSHTKEDARRAKRLALLGMFTGMVGFILQGLLGGTV